MHNLPFDTIALSADEVDALDSIYKTLHEKFEIGLNCELDLPVNKFDVWCCNTGSSVGGVLAVNHPVNECYLAFIKVHYFYHSIKGGMDTDYYKYKVWGLVKLKKDAGRILIRRETFTDRVLGLVHPVELEFKDDKPFSHKFYVVTNDEDKAIATLNWNLRNLIMQIDNENIIIETADNLLIVGNDNWLDTDEVVSIAETAYKIASLR
jgi:hypothetical protein